MERLVSIKCTPPLPSNGASVELYTLGSTTRSGKETPKSRRNLSVLGEVNPAAVVFSEERAELVVAELGLRVEVVGVGPVCRVDVVVVVVLGRCVKDPEADVDEVVVVL